MPTSHSLIYRAHERSLSPDELWPQLDALFSAIYSQDVKTTLKLLECLIPEWQRSDCSEK